MSMIREIFNIAQQTSAIITEPFFYQTINLKHLTVQIYAYFQVYDLSKGPNSYIVNTSDEFEPSWKIFSKITKYVDQNDWNVVESI